MSSYTLHAIAPTPPPRGAVGPARARARKRMLRVDPDWTFDGEPHRGYLAAALLEAAAAEVADADFTPRSVTVHFSDHPTPGRAALTTHVQRIGAGYRVSAHLTRPGEILASALASFGRDFGLVTDAESAPPPMPNPIRLPALRAPDDAPYARLLLMRQAYAGEPDRHGGYVRLRHPREIDAPTLTLLSDAWTATGDDRATRVCELRVDFKRALPTVALAPRHFLKQVFTTSERGEDVTVHRGRIWSANDQLLAEVMRTATR